MNKECRRVLSDAQSNKVQIKLVSLMCAALDDINAESMVGSRPHCMPEAIAKILCSQLLDSGFVLNTKMKDVWQWDKVVPNTSIRHTICYMGYVAGMDWIEDGMVVKATSEDILAHQDQCLINSVTSSTNVEKWQNNLEQLLAWFEANENIWHHGSLSGYSRVEKAVAA